MTKRQRTTAELEELLLEQLQFLEASAESFDRGFEGEAKRLAVAVRVLLHDTAASHSLLGQLGKKAVLFSDTALPDTPGNETTHGGLVFIAVGGKQTRYVAMLDDMPQIREIPFDEWWTANIFVDDRKAALSRKDLVLTAANQDGGAHVDPALNEVYARLSKDNSMGWMATDAGGTRPMPGPERVAIRQLAHEVLKTLKSGYEKKIKYDAGMLVGGVSIKTGANATFSTPPAWAIAKPAVPSNRSAPKVGRNEKCPCGSGRKYKSCHGSRV